MSALAANLALMPGVSAPPAPVRVIEVIAGWPDRGGGISQYMTYVLEENAALGVLDVAAVIDPRGRGRASATLWRLPLALAQLARMRLREGAAPIVHIHMAGRLSTLRKCAMLLWAKALGYRVALHYHEYGFAAFLAGLPAPLRALTRAALRRADRHIVLGEGERSRLPPLLGVPADRFTAIVNGVPRARLERPRAPEPGRILFIGALSERKGVGELIHALAELPGARLALCGGGPFVAEFQALAAAVGVAERCEFLGACPPDRVEAELARAEIFCLPSRAEGLSVALLEAMAAGCPVVATLVGEHAQALRAEENALVVEPGDATGIARALARLHADPALRARLAEAARRTVAEGFTSDLALRRIGEALRA